MDEKVARDFFYDWKRTDFNPNFTPDGRSWAEQDEMFQHDVWMWFQIDEWADHQAKNPKPKIKAPPMKIQDIREL